MWDVIKNPGWIYFEQSTRRTRIRNQAKAAAEIKIAAEIKTWVFFEL